MAIEEAAYTVTMRDGAFEIREYAPHVVAETLVEGTLEEAGNTAFNRLFRYISGGNRSREKVAEIGLLLEALGTKIARELLADGNKAP